MPKLPLILIVSVLRFLYKDFPVSKEIIEGLSITTKLNLIFSKILRILIK